MLSSISECDCIFAKKQNLRFTGEDLAVCSGKTGQHDWRVEPLASQNAILAGHCPLNSCCFDPWLQRNPLTFVIHFMQLKSYSERFEPIVRVNL